jgi:hypothetical protein
MTRSRGEEEGNIVRTMLQPVEKDCGSTKIK